VYNRPHVVVSYKLVTLNITSVTTFIPNVYPFKLYKTGSPSNVRLRLKRDGTRAETGFPLSAKRTSPFKSARASVQSNTGSRGVRISGSNAGYIMFQSSVNCTRYPLHSPVSSSLPHLFHHISAGLY